jgi:hypothetical protein
MTVAGVAKPLPALCCKPVLVSASLVGGGVCIGEKSMVTGRVRANWLPSGLIPVFFAELGSGEDDNRREMSTGGRGRLSGTKWLTWNSGSSGVRGFKLYELDGRSSMGVDNMSDGV